MWPRSSHARVRAPDPGPDMASWPLTLVARAGQCFTLLTDTWCQRYLARPETMGAFYYLFNYHWITRNFPLPGLITSLKLESKSSRWETSFQNLNFCCRPAMDSRAVNGVSSQQKEIIGSRVWRFEASFYGDVTKLCFNFWIKYLNPQTLKRFSVRLFWIFHAK